MTVLSEKNKTRYVAMLCMAAYFVSYVTRTNYGAVVAEMVRDTGLPKTVLSFALTGSFMTYGIGQIISGFFGDKIQPRKLVFYGFIVTSAMNLALPFCTTQALRTAAWCVNGMAQAFMWPPIVRLMASSLSGAEYKRATLAVSIGGSLGNVAVYLFSPILISIWGWKSVFLASALLGVVMAVVWQRLSFDLPEQEAVSTENKKSNSKFSAFPILAFVMLAIVIQGALRDGVTTWMPSYVSETYDLSSAVSILTGVVIPAFSMVSCPITLAIFNRVKNPMLGSGIIFGIGALSAFVLGMTSGQNAVVSIALFALLTGCMHGVNLILVCMLPPFFKNQGRISFMAGLLNFCTYVGSSVSAFGVAALAENTGWTVTILGWFAAAAAGTVICLACGPAWNRFSKKL